MSEELKKCAACRTEKPVSKMKVCMHAEMHRYVCDSKCMADFYSGPKKDATHPAPAEKVEVRGLQWLDTGHYRKKPPKYGYNPHDWNELMTVAQHQRIMAATVPANTVEVPICRLGALGRAYDTPAVCRAYTYKEQPLNDHAWKLGQAASAVKPGGDYIDTGLSLLQQLEEAGFGVFELRALREVKP